MRVCGYYWVLQDYEIGWEPAYWNESHWVLIGQNKDYFDDEFQEINEKQIEYENSSNK